MTALIATIFVAVRLVVLLPVAHDDHCHEAVPACDCSRDAGHIHPAHQHAEEHDCLACQLLPVSFIVAEALEIEEARSTACLVLFHEQEFRCYCPWISARAPPGELNTAHQS